MSALTRTIALALTVTVATPACSKQSSYLGMFVGAAAIPTGYLVDRSAQSEAQLGKALWGGALIAGGSLLLLGSTVSLLIAVNEPKPSSPPAAPPVDEEDRRAVETYRACIANRIALQRAALALNDPDDRREKLAALPVCDGP